MRVSTFWVVIIALIILWVLARILAWALGGLIHILLIIALVMIIARLWQGKKII
jgi:hypothetical protein